jgi:anti-anti-sigma factor
MAAVTVEIGHRDPARAPGGIAFLRLPGELGPVLHLRGELLVTTAEAARRELRAAIGFGHPALIVDLTGCRSIDVDGVLVLLEGFKQLRGTGRRLALVADQPRLQQFLNALGIDWLVPVYSSTAAALTGLRGGETREEPPGSWEAALASTFAFWSRIYGRLAEAPTDILIREVTAEHDLCRQAESASPSSDVRCERCPLFTALGGQPEDAGCRSLTEPIAASILAEDRGAARSQVRQLLELLSDMPLPSA